MAAALPLLMTYGAAAGAVYQGVQQKNAADANARVQQQEATVASRQGYAAEESQRREGTLAIGRQTAAIGQAGGGYGGSAGRELAASAQNAELDALNIRYKAGLQRWGYTTQAGLTKREGQDDMASSFVLAGTKALKSKYGGYENPGSYPALAE